MQMITYNGGDNTGNVDLSPPKATSLQKLKSRKHNHAQLTPPSTQTSPYHKKIVVEASSSTDDLHMKSPSHDSPSHPVDNQNEVSQLSNNSLPLSSETSPLSSIQQDDSISTQQDDDQVFKTVSPRRSRRTKKSQIGSHVPKGRNES